MRLAAVAIALCALAPAARADGGETGRTAVVGASPIARGLEQWIPRGGAYERALQAVRDAQYRRAAELFRDAAAEARTAGLQSRLPDFAAKLVYARAMMSSARASRLWERQHDDRGTVDALEAAVELHNLTLAARAFSGHDEEPLVERTFNAYRALLTDAGAQRMLPDRLVTLHLCFAELLATAGRRRAALRELQRVSEAEVIALGSSEATAGLLIEMAAARAALGERDHALDLLEDARAAHPSWEDVRVAAVLLANDFDALRDDPRFVALAGRTAD